MTRNKMNYSGHIHPYTTLYNLMITIMRLCVLAEIMSSVAHRGDGSSNQVRNRSLRSPPCMCVDV